MPKTDSLPATRLPATDDDSPPEQPRQDELIRQLAERIRLQRLRQQLRRIRQPASRT
jgi:hypothetical protein